MLQINRDFKKQVSGKFDGMKFLLYFYGNFKWRIMGSNSYKYDKELFELLKQEYKERLKIQLTLGSYEKLRSFINKET